MVALHLDEWFHHFITFRLCSIGIDIRKKNRSAASAGLDNYIQIRRYVMLCYSQLLSSSSKCSTKVRDRTSFQTGGNSDNGCTWKAGPKHGRRFGWVNSIWGDAPTGTVDWCFPRLYASHVSRPGEFARNYPFRQTLYHSMYVKWC